jgi:hypothetical protein
MHALSAKTLLELWEDVHTQAPVERALSLLAAADTENTVEQLAAFSLGDRNARLLALREVLFGSEMEALAVCPRCGQRLELRLNATELRNMCGPGPNREVTLSIDGYEVRLRPLNSLDLPTITSEAELASAHDYVLRRCLLSVHNGNMPVEFEELPGEVVEASAQKIAEIDPLADIQISICCHSCQHIYQAAFDILSFLWKEIDAWARRVLIEVHILASAYGWSEREILALGAPRRQFYLDMVGA